MFNLLQLDFPSSKSNSPSKKHKTNKKPIKRSHSSGASFLNKQVHALFGRVRQCSLCLAAAVGGGVLDLPLQPVFPGATVSAPSGPPGRSGRS